MLRTRVAAIVTLIAACTAVLAGCGTNGSATATAKVSTAVSKAAGEVKAGLAALDFTAGTAKSNNAPANTGDFFHGPSDSPAAMQWVQLSAGSAGALNPVVLNGAGFTLYRFDKDTTAPSKSNCDGACATAWPPVLVKQGGRIFLDGVSKEKVGTVKRDDGTLQVTIGGSPVYRFAKDTAPGQTNGQGVGGTWFGVTPDGTKAGQSQQGTDPTTGLSYKNGTAKQNGAPQTTGDLYQGKRTDPAAMNWVELTSGSANGLNPVVHDGAGFTLYRFDKDTTAPSKSNCDGACATAWPPVLVRSGTKIFVNGVPTNKIGVVRRDDGTLQVTIGGSPVYRFAKDTGPGQTNGEGVGGTWFAVSPQGQRVLPPVTAVTAPPSASATASASTVTLGNGSAILDSGTNFSEPDGSVGVAGPGCQNLSPPFTALSVQLDGGPIKIWSGPTCTGTSAVLTASIADLSTIGFNQKIASVRFGG